MTSNSNFSGHNVARLVFNSTGRVLQTCYNYHIQDGVIVEKQKEASWFINDAAMREI